MGLALVVGVLTARYLGPSNYGTLNYAASLVSVFSIICCLGLEGIIIKELVSERSREGIILGTGIAMRFIAGLLSMTIIAVIVVILNPGDKILLIVAFLQSLALIFQAFQIIDFWYQSKLKSKISTIVKCISYTVMSLYKVALLVLGKSVIWFAFSTSVDAIIIAVLYVILYVKHSDHSLTVSYNISKSLLRQSYHFIISGLMVALYSQMGKLMIGKILTQTDVGIYSAAITICNLWVFIPLALANSARPVIMELKGIDQEKYIVRIKQLLSLTVWSGIVFAVLITINSNFIIRILFGEAYIKALSPLIIAGWANVFGSLSYTRGIWMICEDKQRFIKRIMIWGVIVNLVLNAILIPTIGINGAAIATLVTEIVCCLVAPAFYKEIKTFVGFIFKSFLFRFK